MLSDDPCGRSAARPVRGCFWVRVVVPGRAPAARLDKVGLPREPVPPDAPLLLDPCLRRVAVRFGRRLLMELSEACDRKLVVEFVRLGPGCTIKPPPVELTRRTVDSEDP